MLRHTKLLPFLMMFLILAMPVVFGATVTVQFIAPNGSVLANATVKIIGVNYSKEVTLDSNGTAKLNLTEGKNYLLIAKGDDFKIIGLIENATDNTSLVFDASKYNYTKITIQPTELVVKVKFYYSESGKFKDLVYEFEAPDKLYIQPVENITLEFQKQIAKGIYVYRIKDIKYDNTTVENATVELNPANKNEVTAEYVKTVNPFIVLLLALIVLILIALALSSGKKATTAHIIREKIEYVRRK